MLNRSLKFIGISVFGILALIALAATLIPLIPHKAWYIQIFDYPRLQTFFIAVIALIWYCTFYFKRGRKGLFFVVLFVIVIIVQAYKAWPYTPLAHKQVLWANNNGNDSSTISLFICNVLQTNTAYNKVIEEINFHHPDIIITTESNNKWQTALGVLKNDYPYGLGAPLDNFYGMHLYSRLPLDESILRYLMEPDIPSIRTKVKLPSGEWITLFVVHPRPPVPGESSDSRERDAEIIMVANEAQREKGGVIVAGDFNDVAWSKNTKLFQEVTGYLDPRRGRGFYNTYHADIPFFRWPLDHIFHSSHFKLVNMKRVGTVNSDHFPMYVKLDYEPENKLDQPAVKPEASTKKEAAETIQEGKNDKDAPGQ
ncbi:MAG: endonuclease/exonuclease/phosphatase family protein [Bacteroidota bacterium]